MRQHEHTQANDAGADLRAAEAKGETAVTPRNKVGQPKMLGHDHLPPPPMERSAAALRASRMLAFPTPVAATAAQGPTGMEHDLLLTAHGILGALALPAVDALVVPDGSSWRVLPAHEHDLAISLGEIPLLDVIRGEPLPITATRYPVLWAALAPWHTQALPRPLARIVLVPVVVRDEPRALCLLGFAAGSGDEAEWLPAAGAVATACAAGIQALRVEQRVEAEGRARDAYISMAAHELRSPLTSIKGYAQLLMRQARKTSLPEPMQRSVESIEQQTVRMTEMVGELLDASRIRRNAIELVRAPTDLVALARKAIERRAALHTQHTFTMQTAEVALPGDWDAARIEQVLRDLLENAARYSPAGGRIEVRLWREGDAALVAVTDQGIGVAEADRERIFEYLYRSPIAEQRNLSGLGLGLFISRHLVEWHGGWLTLHATSTAEPSGSEFRLMLPLMQSAPPS
jgi:signal transduction histidine kinase